MPRRKLATAEIPARPRQWVFRGACRGADPELFFADNGDGHGYGRILDSDPRVQEAKAYCRRCPVANQCLFAAIRDEEHGVWGGTTPAEREALRRWEWSLPQQQRRAS